MKKIYSAITFICLTVLSLAQPREFIGKVFVAGNGLKLPYKMLLPDNYDPELSYPLVIFLHGSGERGRDNWRQVSETHGGKMLRTDANLRQAIVIAPQCPLNSQWADYLTPAFLNRFPESPAISKPLAAVKELADSLIGTGRVDEKRVYGIGYSMGAFGLLDLAVRYPDMFAAIISICGGINTKRLEGFNGRTEFRFYHGKMDIIILPVFSRRTHEALKAQGIKSELIEYKWLSHSCWNKAFKEPDFTEWIFER